MAPAYQGAQRKRRHYRTVPTDVLCDMGSWVRGLGEPDGLLFLWAPDALVVDGTAQRVAAAWGYTPKTVAFTWIKTDKRGRPRMGGGNYTRKTTELCLMCTRPRGAQRIKRHDIIDVLFAQRLEHSRKPDVSYERIEQLADGPYLELFARRVYSPAWTAWGDEL